MKRTSVALGILGLVYAVVLPGASAAVLFKADFSTSPFKGFGGVAPYMQGLGGLQRSDTTVPPFFLLGGVLRSSPADSTAGSDGVSGDNDPPGVRFLLLTGDPKWADVSITSKIRIDAQNTGGVALVLRAAPKTKVADPDTWYEFRYTTGNSPAPNDEQVDSGIAPPETNPNLRIMKVVKGKWTKLAENTAAQEASIPAINAAGDYNESGAIFRFIAKGDLLQGFISLDGTNFTKVLEAHDSELKAGVIGVSHFDYNPWFYSLLVEDAP